MLELYQHPHHVLEGENGQNVHDKVPARRTGFACCVQYISKITMRAGSSQFELDQQRNAHLNDNDMLGA